MDDPYIDGVSVTHGRSPRQHVWSFVSAAYETAISYGTQFACSCTNTNFNWQRHTIPSFINNDYFCDTGNAGPGVNVGTYYTDNAIWDGEGCGPTNACCEFNNPPWFCKTLPQPTSDDIELRICSDQSTSNEDTIISLVDIHVQ